MKVRVKPIEDLDPRIRQLSQLFWPLSDLERRIAPRLYRLLAQAVPVAVPTLAERAGVTLQDAESTLAAWPGVFKDDNGQVVGFWGLTISPTKHRLIVGEHTLYTWCAWDTLFIPEILGQPVSVRSLSPVDSAEIAFEVRPRGVADAAPPDTMVSFVLPRGENWTRDILANFCHLRPLLPERA
ncbi:MAG: organomercurial lyase [Chromatiales bacterium]